MAQVFHFGPYYWFGPFETAAARGAAQLVLGTKPRIRSVWFTCHGSPRAKSNSY